MTDSNVREDTNKQSVIVDWIVNYGPDPSHITNRSRVVRRLRDAKRLVRRLPAGRPWQILKMQTPRKSFSVVESIDIVDQSFPIAGSRRIHGRTQNDE